MRVQICAAIFLLCVFGTVGSYFVPSHWWRASPQPEQPKVETAKPKPTSTSKEKEDDARKKLAFISIAGRLPKGKPITPTKPLDAEAKKRWEVADGNLARAQGERAELLKALHEKTRNFFVESPGTGSGRDVWIPPEGILMDSWHGGGDPIQPGPPADFPVSASESLTRVQPDREFHWYHEGGISDFLYPTGFGYVKDRLRVAGFKPHGFRYLGVPVHESKVWRIQHVLLIGILTQAQPVVYLTDKLPSMEQIRQDKVRPLDFFEEAGMPSLRDGEDLYIVRKGDTLRMLGALRATKTCQKCHDAEIGDLLGAFSYTLRPAPKL
jgi:hypothetical protein